MAEAEIARHAETAMSRWPLSGISIIHRVGRITPGENIVLVVTASKHRQAAFEAAEFLMDYLKANAPFWKRVDRPDGTSWIEARDHDETAAARWTKS
jgi:molybdopterin synthase catalytic subunit